MKVLKISAIVFVLVLIGIHFVSKTVEVPQDRIQAGVNKFFGEDGKKWEDKNGNSIVLYAPKLDLDVEEAGGSTVTMSTRIKFKGKEYNGTVVASGVPAMIWSDDTVRLNELKVKDLEVDGLSPLVTMGILKSVELVLGDDLVKALIPEIPLYEITEQDKQYMGLGTFVHLRGAQLGKQRILFKVGIGLF